MVNKENEKKYILNQDIRSCVFSSFKSNININYTYKDYLEEQEKSTLIANLARLVMLTEDEETLDLCMNKKISKSELISYILDNQEWVISSNLMNMDSLTFNSLNNLISLLNKNGYYKFNNLEKTNFNIQVQLILIKSNLGFIKTDENITEIHIPKDNLKIIKKLLKDEDVIYKVEETSELLNRISGLINIYGVIKLNDLPILDSYFKDYSYYEIQSIIWRLKVDEPLFDDFIYNDEIVLHSCDINDIDKIMEIFKIPLDYKKYDEETLIKFYDNKYIEDLAPYKEFIRSLKKAKCPDELRDYIKNYVFKDYIIGSQYDVKKAKDCFLRNVYQFSDDDEFNNILLDYAVKIANKFPRWDLKGDISQNETIKVEKVGRNEPCPCGSGKKYKKCCGK